MKNNLLITTALVAVSFVATNAWAGTQEDWDGKAGFSGQSSATAVKKVTDNVTANDVTVSDNKNTGDGVGGAVYVQKPTEVNQHKAGSLTLNGGRFQHNKSKYDGGAIGNYGNLTVNGTKFVNNMTQLDGKDTNNPIGGGALSLGIDSHTTIRDALFDSNWSGFNGGAIATRKTVEEAEEKNPLNHSLEIYNSTFVGNQAVKNQKNDGGYGGAIATTFEGTKISGSTFSANRANKGGGAIYLTGLVKKNGNTLEDETHRGGTLFIENSTFNKNHADEKKDGQGGAILAGTNSTLLDIRGSTFKGNTAKVGGGAIWSGSTTNIVSSTFEDNKVTGTGNTPAEDNDTNKYEGGGAIFVGSRSHVTVTDSTFKGNSAGTAGGAIAMRGDDNDGKQSSLTINSSHFIQNTSQNAGGAISVGSEKQENVNIADTEFTGNTAVRGGAIYNRGKTNILGNTTFTGNKTEGRGAVGGAIVNSGVLTIEGATFDGNTSTGGGGAIYNSSNGGQGELIIKGGRFVNNEGKNGGAISNGQDATLKISDNALFENNHAKGDGGAISTDAKFPDQLSITDATFRNNSADGKGGALNIAGRQDDVVEFNGNVVFEGNKDSEGANDIHFGSDKGTITVKGNLSLDGGISCAGDSCANATVKLEENSTLTVKDTTTVASKVENGKDSAKVNIVLTEKTMNEGEFNLTDIFTANNGTIDAVKKDLKLESNNLYEVKEGENNVYTVKERSAGEAAGRLGVREIEAATLLATSSSKTGSGNEAFDDIQDTLRHEAQYGNNSALLSRSADALVADAAPTVRVRAKRCRRSIFRRQPA